MGLLKQLPLRGTGKLVAHANAMPCGQAVIAVHRLTLTLTLASRLVLRASMAAPLYQMAHQVRAAPFQVLVDARSVIQATQTAKARATTLPSLLKRHVKLLALRGLRQPGTLAEPQTKIALLVQMLPHETTLLMEKVAFTSARMEVLSILLDLILMRRDASVDASAVKETKPISYAKIRSSTLQICNHHAKAMLPVPTLEVD